MINLIDASHLNKYSSSKLWKFSQNNIKWVGSPYGIVASVLDDNIVVIKLKL